jgi:hypothetical protein
MVVAGLSRRSRQVCPSAVHMLWINAALSRS